MICLGLTVYNYSEISVPFYVRVSFSRTCGLAEGYFWTLVSTIYDGAYLRKLKKLF